MGVTLFFGLELNKPWKWLAEGLKFQIHLFVYFQWFGLGFLSSFLHLSTIVYYERLPEDFWSFGILKNLMVSIMELKLYLYPQFKGADSKYRIYFS